MVIDDKNKTLVENAFINKYIYFQMTDQFHILTFLRRF